MSDKVTPQNGGCWYCHTIDSRPLAFSGEFDTNVHLDCLRNHVSAHPDDPEARIMARELLEGEVSV